MPCTYLANCKQLTNLCLTWMAFCKVTLQSRSFTQFLAKCCSDKLTAAVCGWCRRFALYQSYNLHLLAFKHRQYSRLSLVTAGYITVIAETMKCGKACKPARITSSELAPTATVGRLSVLISARDLCGVPSAPGVRGVSPKRELLGVP